MRPLDDISRVKRPRHDDMSLLTNNVYKPDNMELHDILRRRLSVAFSQRQK